MSIIERLAQLEERVKDLEQTLRSPSSGNQMTDAQKVACAKAVFDNDYTDMNRLKEAGEWITPKSW